MDKSEQSPLRGLGQPTDNIPHEVDFFNSRATELAPGVTLFTKNGLYNGNAVIIRQFSPIEIDRIASTLAAYLTKTEQRLWLVETDFGNQLKLCDNEIHELFELGRSDNYDRWFDARLELIKRNAP